MSELSLATLREIEMVGTVKQANPGVATDGDTDVPIHFNREYAVQVNSREAMVDQWTRQGRVFIASTPVQGTKETMSANGTAITLTAPSLRYTVPSGQVVVPISVQICGDHTTAKHALFNVLVTQSDSFTSGGDAVLMTPRNALVNAAGDLRGSSVTKLHYSDTAIVEAALVGERGLKAIYKNATATDETDWNPEYNILKGDPMVYLRGPASFLVYVVEETAALEAEWVMSWAELDSAVVP